MKGTRWGVHVWVVDGTLGLTERVGNLLMRNTRTLTGKVTAINMFKLGEGAYASKDEEGKCEVYRNKIQEEYDGCVLGSKVPRDPPIRGLFGEARIDLIEGAVPVRQKPYMLHGERLEAHKTCAQDWIDRGYIEPIPGGKENSEWLSMTSPVPKKNPGE